MYKYYEGGVQIEFILKDTKQDLFLDYSGRISKLVLNNIEKNAFSSLNDKIYLNKRILREGTNTLYIAFENKYSSSSFKGLNEVKPSCDF